MQQCDCGKLNIFPEYTLALGPFRMLRLFNVCGFQNPPFFGVCLLGALLFVLASSFPLSQLQRRSTLGKGGICRTVLSRSGAVMPQQDLQSSYVLQSCAVSRNSVVPALVFPVLNCHILLNYQWEIVLLSHRTRTVQENGCSQHEKTSHPVVSLVEPYFLNCDDSLQQLPCKSYGIWCTYWRRLVFVHIRCAP